MFLLLRDHYFIIYTAQASTMSRQDKSYKILVLGATRTGKTSLVKMFVESQLEGEPSMTIGAVVFKKEVNIDNGRVVLDLWDVEEPRLVFTSEDSYFNGTRGVVIVYDITRRDTLNEAVECCKKCTKQGLIHIPRILVGNKIDLESDREVSREEVNEIADRIHAVHYETSAIDGKNVDDVFLKMGAMVQEMNDITSW